MSAIANSREAFEEGDILGFSRRVRWWRPSTWLSWRIQRTTGSPWNHVGVLRWNGAHGYWEVVEALLSGGVVRTPLVRYERGDLRLVVGSWPGLMFAQRMRIVSFALRAVGSRYDVWKLVRIRLLQLILGNAAAVDEIRNDEHDGLFICSELAIRAYRAAGVDIGGDYAGPGSVVERFEVRGRWDGRRWGNILVAFQKR